MKRKKITTIEDLAVLMQDEFLAIHGRLDEHDRKFKSIDVRFDKMDARFDRLEKRADNMEHKINQLDRRLFSIEEDVAEIKVGLRGKAGAGDMNNLEKRVINLEKLCCAR